jgi:hypothetical protein
MYGKLLLSQRERAPVMDEWRMPMGVLVCTDVTKVWGADTPREVVALDTVSLRV